MTGKSISTHSLNRRRRRAVELRLKGMKLADIAAEVELTPPTIIAAHKAWKSGGWPAVDIQRRGRPETSRTALPAVEQALLKQLISLAPDSHSDQPVWSHEAVAHWLQASRGIKLGAPSIAAQLARWGYRPANQFTRAKRAQSTDAAVALWLNESYPSIVKASRKRRAAILWVAQQSASKHAPPLLYAHSTRGKLHWLARQQQTDTEHLLDFFTRLLHQQQKPLSLVITGMDIQRTAEIKHWLDRQRGRVQLYFPASPDLAIDLSIDEPATQPGTQPPAATPRAMPNATPQAVAKRQYPNSLSTPINPGKPMNLTHLQRLEAESIHIMREVVAESNKPVMLYSAGKDSSVMLHLALKAFYPARLPFPLLHIDTGWKFSALYEFRDELPKTHDLDLITHSNPDGVAKGVNPLSHGSALHTEIMKTQALRQALDQHRFDAAFGGARRDEEAARAKERIFSFRDAGHRWNPKDQRPELWNLYNSKVQAGESMRVFPLSNWTELDIWHYIHREKIALPSLYLSAQRPVVERDGKLIMVDDDRLPLNAGEVPMLRQVRFRTTGCYPLTGAIESSATSIPEIMEELLRATTSERLGRTIDSDNPASMEKKKQQGYF